MARILILTAGFGEGHNTAARCTGEALGALGQPVETKVIDPIALACPRLAGVTREAYLGVINHVPLIWKAVYELADRAGDDPLAAPGMRAACARLASELREFKPNIVITTYPVYVGFWAHLFPVGSPAPCPLVTVVTDSITVNSIWTRGRSDLWCVTDEGTASRLCDLGIDASQIRVTGFPVSPRLAEFQREKAAPAADEPFRLLWFPIASKRHTRAWLNALEKLPSSPAWTCTVVLGKHKDNLRPMIEAAISSGKLPPGTGIIGWTDQIPRLLNEHHAVLGKAGGATVHEARTAARPMGIHYMVPGQEEGNAILLENEKGGRLIAGPSALAALWDEWTRDNFAGWKAAHASLLASAPPDPAHRLARLSLSLLSPTP
ncbi:MAG: MGDG synthase family glycosyltransferase [Verrucomicrobiales bacterium]